MKNKNYSCWVVALKNYSTYVIGDCYELTEEKYFKSQLKSGCIRKATDEEINKAKSQKEDDNISSDPLTICQLYAADRTDEATEGLVKHILNKEYIVTTRDDDKPEMWIYENGIYTPNGGTHINEICRDILGVSYNAVIVSRVTAKIKADTYKDAQEFFDSENGNLIAIENGLLNPITKEIIPHTPDKIFFSKIPVTFNPAADCPNIKQHLKTVLKNEEDIKIMYEIFGWTLTNSYKIEKAVMFIGKGRNGKTKTLSIMNNFLGKDNVAAIPLQEFESDQYAAGNLFQKRANIAGDLGSTPIKDSGLLKHMTGQDPLDANRKYKNRIKFLNNAKMLFSTNELPVTKDLTDGFFSRWVLIDFPYKFVSQKEYEKSTDEERVLWKIADTEIIEKLKTPEELSGLLNLALEGLSRLIKNKDFSNSDTMKEIKNKWLMLSDSFSAFMELHIEEDFEGVVKKDCLRQIYKEFCRKNKVKILSDKKISNRLSETLGVVLSRKTKDGNTKHTFEGIKLKSPNCRDCRDCRVNAKTFISSRIGNFPETPNNLDKVDKINQLIDFIKQSGKVGVNVQEVDSLGFTPAETGEIINHALNKGIIYQLKGKFFTVEATSIL